MKMTKTCQRNKIITILIEIFFFIAFIPKPKKKMNKLFIIKIYFYIVFLDSPAIFSKASPIFPAIISKFNNRPFPVFFLSFKPQKYPEISRNIAGN